MVQKYDTVVIGGGFYGMRIARFFARKGEKVLLVEKADQLFTRASFVNQARIHNGYHYPRSMLTALRSRINLPNFVAEYHDCIDTSFIKLYGIARTNSKINAAQFFEFSSRIGAKISPASSELASLFSTDTTEAVFEVEEFAFNAIAICEKLEKEVLALGVDILLGTSFDHFLKQDDFFENFLFSKEGNIQKIYSRKVFSCTYASLNQIHEKSGLPIIPLKQEFVEMILVDVPDLIKNIGITVMDGPFFSCMPFPAKKLHTLSHVRYTPRFFWNENQEGDTKDIDGYINHFGAPESGFQFMIRDAARFMPILSDAIFKESMFTIKTLLQKSEMSDSRPILFRSHHGVKNFYAVMGGKIDNIYDIEAELDLIFS